LSPESGVLSPEGQMEVVSPAEHRKVVGELTGLKAKLRELLQ